MRGYPLISPQKETMEENKTIVEKKEPAITAIKKPQKKPVSKPKSQYEIDFDRDNKLVKGIFRCHEVRGGTIVFHFRKYKENPVAKYTLTDGKVYEIPYMVAKHLTNNCWYPIHRYMQDENGDISAKIGQKVRRCSFEPLEFIDMQDYENVDLVTVQKV